MQNVWLEVSLDYYEPGMEQQVLELAKKFNTQVSGSGRGFGLRDWDFLLDDLKTAEEFMKAAEELNTLFNARLSSQINFDK